MSGTRASRDAYNRGYAEGKADTLKWAGLPPTLTLRDVILLRVNFGLGPRRNTGRPEAAARELGLSKRYVMRLTRQLMHKPEMVQWFMDNWPEMGQPKDDRQRRTA